MITFKNSDGGFIESRIVTIERDGMIHTVIVDIDINRILLRAASKAVRAKENRWMNKAKTVASEVKLSEPYP